MASSPTIQITSSIIFFFWADKPEKIKRKAIKISDILRIFSFLADNRVWLADLFND
jgi:hypothetical protein